MDPLVAIGLFVGIPVGLAIIVAVAVLVPQKYGSATVVSDSTKDAWTTGEGSGLITSSAAVPNPVALPSETTGRVEVTGGARGNW